MKRNRYLSMIIMGIAVVIILISAMFQFETLVIVGIIVLYIGGLVSIDNTCPNCKKHIGGGRGKIEYCPFCGKKIE